VTEAVVVAIGLLFVGIVRAVVALIRDAVVVGIAVVVRTRGPAVARVFGFVDAGRRGIADARRRGRACRRAVVEGRGVVVFRAGGTRARRAVGGRPVTR